MIQEFYNFAVLHKAAAGVAAAWALREAHNLWPYLRPSVSLPFFRQNGGLRGIAATILAGSPGPTQLPAKETPDDSQPKPTTQ